MKYLIIKLLICICVSFVQAQQESQFLGKWKTIDDETKQAKSIIEIYKKDQALFAKVIELLPAATIKTCNRCPGEKNGKSLIGMDIMWNMTPDNNDYSNGQIMDPKSGKIYSCTIALEGTEKLLVRGYIGISLFGRTQTWERVK
ncbi:MAG: DUF2147 domain-containing protein [Saprospiraceae bacterium]|nr:DUF2147 domain-containing protein [Candidatus Defluviibacterium haderslevense]MBL0235858.1 DUF2147 domain-containing protein [Candidatus Defluviibacterium haderslevense]